MGQGKQSFSMFGKNSSVVVAMIALICLLSFANSAHAIDKRLKLMFKTAGYGAAAGFVIGAGTMALGLGGFRNVLMGTSSGMYAGILLAAYIVATPDDSGKRRRSRNPYAPRRSIGPEDWEDEPQEDEELREHLPNFDRDNGRLEPQRQRSLSLWAPLVSLHF